MPEDLMDICPKTQKRHIPDYKSVSTEWDGDALYVDVNCKDCGRSGCITKVNEDEINW